MESTAVVLKRAGELRIERIEVPEVGGESVVVEMGACGICGSDVRYYQGENPWSLHTLGKNLPSPPNMVLGHEVSGVVRADQGERRVAILAYRACGSCEYCRSGRENLCDEMEHFGHSAGWKSMEYYPGGMSRRFRIWRDFAYEIPQSVSFEEATFLDGLAVAIHAVDVSGVCAGDKIGVVGLGPIGLLAAQVARARGVEEVYGCDVYGLPIRLAADTGFEHVVQSGSEGLAALSGGNSLAAVIDTVGSQETISDGLSVLAKSGSHVLLAVHEEPVSLPPIALSGERRILSSANNMYRDFPEAIRMLAAREVRVGHLITHRFGLDEAEEAFDLMLSKGQNEAYKIVLHP